jgi:RND family efflux transporter MFP subunit
MTDLPPTPSSAPGPPTLLSRLGRLTVPALVLAAGVVAYLILSAEPEKAKNSPGVTQPIRTRVQELQVRDYPVAIKTHGVVRPCDEVTLSAQVSGLITRTSPAFEAGAFFAEGETLVELDANDYRIAVAVAEARLLGAKAALQLATLDHERNLKLFRDKLISDAAADQTSAVRAQAAAEVDSAIAQVERAKRDLDRTKIRAPFDGRVRHKAVGLGQSVGPGTPLGVVFAVDFAEVRLPIAGRELQFLKLPEKLDDPHVDVELRDAVGGASGTVWKAKIVRTDGALDDNSLELFAIARVDDPFGLKSGNPPLRIGQPVTAFIAGRLLTNVVALPRMGVRQLDQIILIDKQDLTLTPKTIIPLWADEEHVVVRDPAIHDGVLLSTTQLVYAPAGSKVEIIPDILAAPAVGTNVLAQTKPGDKPREEKSKP